MTHAEDERMHALAPKRQEGGKTEGNYRQRSIVEEAIYGIIAGAGALSRFTRLFEKIPYNVIFGGVLRSRRGFGQAPNKLAQHIKLLDPLVWNQVCKPAYRAPLFSSLHNSPTHFKSASILHGNIFKISPKPPHTSFPPISIFNHCESFSLLRPLTS
jgi:hypothetical protein